MSRRARRLERRARRRRAALLGGAVLVVAVAAAAAFSLRSNASTTTTTTTPGAHATTTAAGAATGQPTLPAVPGWGVIARTARGVAVDQRWITVPGGQRVYVLRFRRGAVGFHFHVGQEDPPGATAVVPADAQPLISRSEWRVGVLGVFNGGFKMAADAGGLSADGYVAGGLHPGMPTAVIDTQGQLTIGTWGGGEPQRGHPVVAARQNLSYLIYQSKISAYIDQIAPWGITLGGVNAVARTGIAVNKGGDVLYAVGKTLLPVDLARALLAAGAVNAMELDINPYWPIAGANNVPLHAPGEFKVNNPYSQHLASVYNTGWLRDFFVVLAEPDHPSCSLTAPTPVPHKVSPEPPRVTCAPAG